MLLEVTFFLLSSYPPWNFLTFYINYTKYIKINSKFLFPLPSSPLTLAFPPSLFSLSDTHSLSYLVWNSFQACLFCFLQVQQLVSEGLLFQWLGLIFSKTDTPFFGSVIVGAFTATMATLANVSWLLLTGAAAKILFDLLICTCSLLVRNMP